MKLTDERLQAELRELREGPSEDFAAELDAWAAAGFPANESDRRPGRRLFSRPTRFRVRSLMPVIGYATPLILIALVIVAVPKGGDDTDESGGDTAPMVAPESADDVNEGGAPGGVAERGGDGVVEPLEPGTTGVPPTPPDRELKPGRERVQERSASMTLSTDADEVDDIADGVVEVTERYEGIVVSSEVTTKGDVGRANFDLRIPTANLQAALSDLSDLATVSARNEGTLDITAPFMSAEERFGDAKAEVDALLDELANADDATEIAAIREQLQVARDELAGARSELGALKQRADFSRLAVTVTGDGDADGWSLGDAADDAVSVLEDLLGAGLVALAVIVPLGGLALLAWFGWGRLRRRRREATLDE